MLVGDELQGAEGGEDDVEGVRVEGQLRGTGQHGGYDDPVLLVDPAAVLQLAHRDVDGDRSAAVTQHPARALPGAAADLEHVATSDVAECVQGVLADALGTPEEPAVAQELAVGGLVLVGVGVPVGLVGAQGLRLTDRTPLGPHS